MLRANLSMRVTIRTSPSRRKSRMFCSCSLPAVVVPLRFSDLMISALPERRPRSDTWNFFCFS
jgi:hypothetical protein